MTVEGGVVTYQTMKAWRKAPCWPKYLSSRHAVTPSTAMHWLPWMHVYKSGLENTDNLGYSKLLSDLQKTEICNSIDFVNFQRFYQSNFLIWSHVACAKYFFSPFSFFFFLPIRGWWSHSLRFFFNDPNPVVWLC